MENKEIKKKVYGHYESGLHCAEVISKTVLETFSDETHSEAIKSASGFGGGIGGSMEELCGAFTGGVVTLGCLLGRENPGDNLRDCGTLTKEFTKKFLNEFGSLNCQTILGGFKEQENPVGCVKLTANAAAILADLLSEFEAKSETSLDTFCCQPRDKVEPGQCPFSACAC